MELCRRLGLSWGTVGHHVRVLSASGHLRARHIGHRMHFATPHQLAGVGGDWTLVRPEAQRVVRALARGDLGPAALSRRTGLGTKQLRGLLRDLAEAGAVGSDDGYHPRYHLIRANIGSDVVLQIPSRVEERWPWCATRHVQEPGIQAG